MKRSPGCPRCHVHTTSLSPQAVPVSCLVQRYKQKEFAFMSGFIYTLNQRLSFLHRGVESPRLVSGISRTRRRRSSLTYTSRLFPYTTNGGRLFWSLRHRPSTAEMYLIIIIIIIIIITRFICIAPESMALLSGALHACTSNS